MKCIVCEVPLWDPARWPPGDFATMLAIKEGEAEEVGGYDYDGEPACLCCYEKAKADCESRRIEP